MFRIVTSKINEVLESLDYVKMQDNGIPVRCEEKDAQAILTKDHSTILSLPGKGLEEMYEVAVVTRVNLDEYLDEYTKPMQEKNDMLESCILEMSEIVYA